MFRRVLALMLLLGPAADAVASWRANATPDPHRCDDHVCACPREARPKRGEQACHEDAQPATQALQSRCGHESPAPRLAGIRPYLLPEPALSEPGRDFEPAVAAAEAAAADGFERADREPPRSR